MSQMESRYSLGLMAFLLEHVGMLKPQEVNEVLTNFRVMVWSHYVENQENLINDEMKQLLERAGEEVLKMVAKDYPHAVSKLKGLKFDQIKIEDLG